MVRNGGFYLECDKKFWNVVQKIAFQFDFKWENGDSIVHDIYAKEPFYFFFNVIDKTFDMYTEQSFLSDSYMYELIDLPDDLEKFTDFLSNQIYVGSDQVIFDDYVGCINIGSLSIDYDIIREIYDRIEHAK